jgi:uncharacterized protein
MSEYITNSKKRVEDLFRFSQGIINGEDGSELLLKYGDTLKSITPHDMIAMEEKQLKMGINPSVIKAKIEKVMNVLYDYLRNYQWEKPESGHPLDYFRQENRELEKVLGRIKQNLRVQDVVSLKKNIKALFVMDRHYLRKENILFPFLEKTWENCRPLSVMWSLHDDIRLKLKKLDSHISKSAKLDKEFYSIIGELFFLMYGMILKEELVIFPVAMETLTKTDWREIAAQSHVIGFSYIDPDLHNTPKISRPAEKFLNENMVGKIFSSATGKLNSEQLEKIFNTLPVDITFIDEKDEVAYFSNPKDRFFPRSPAIIGRKVQNCHPPESVHIVEKILTAFKDGSRDEALFHINMKGRFIMIRYFAVRDDAGKYIGTLEVSQDVTKIRSLKGDRRLLDWD